MQHNPIKQIYKLAINKTWVRSSDNSNKERFFKENKSLCAVVSNTYFLITAGNQRLNMPQEKVIQINLETPLENQRSTSVY